MKIKDSNCVGIISDQGEAATASNLNEYTIKSVQLALTHLQRPPEILCPSAIISLCSTIRILMARFLKQSFA